MTGADNKEFLVTSLKLIFDKWLSQ